MKKEKLLKLMQKSALEAMECLRLMLADPELKASDRLAVAKLLVEYGVTDNERDAGESNRITVVMDGIPKEYFN